MALSDYASMAAVSGVSLQDPNVQAAISGIEQGVSSEGLGSSDAYARVKTFFDAAGNLYQSASGQVTMAGAVMAASKFVKLNSSQAGALQVATNLMQAVSDAASGQESPPEVVAEFSGPIISAMIGAGAVSAGVGAAIVAFVGIGAQMMQSAGIFPDRPGFQVCPGFSLTTPSPPTYAINCLAVFDGAGSISPGNTALWRSFPNPKNPSDGWWFQTPDPNQPFTDWHGARWIPQLTALTPRPVDIAFPGYGMASQPWSTFYPDLLAKLGLVPASLSAEQSKALSDFTAAFFQAWKANAEYWLNGHSGALDWQVLVHFAQVWNRSHAPGQGIDVGNASVANLAEGGAFSMAPYWMTLVSQVARAYPPGIIAADGQRLHINTGAMGAPKVIVLHPVDFGGSKASGTARAIAVPSPITIPAKNAGLTLLPLLAGGAASLFFGPIAVVVGAAATSAWLGWASRPAAPPSAASASVTAKSPVALSPTAVAEKATVIPIIPVRL